jgi:DNA repair protein RecO (recombination protein O)
MLYKTRGVALSFIKYRETSIIARIFTEAFGLQSYIVNGVRSRNAKIKMALFQPLTLLELVVYHNKKKEINRISEIKCSVTFHSIPFNIKKMTIALFITELLGQTVREEEEQNMLFNFINDSIIGLDLMEREYENFHLKFMLYFSHYLGIRPVSAEMILHETGHNESDHPGMIKLLDRLMESDYSKYIQLSKKDRLELLTILIHYYQMHFDSIRELKSVQVLKEVFS